MDIAFRLRAWRAYRDRSLQDVADRCNLTKQAVSLGELGQRQMYVSTLHAIVTKGLDVTMARFFGDPPPNDKESTRARS